MRKLYKVLGCTAVGCLTPLLLLITVMFVIPLWNIGREGPEVSSYNGIQVRNPVACQKINFSPVYNKPLSWIFGRGAAWKLRVAEAQFYCGRQWNHQFFARAASILEREHLLLTDWKDWDSSIIYDAPGVSKEISNFLKVVDAAPILVGGEDVQNEIRKKSPQLPSPEVIRRVIDEIGLKTICTVPHPIPQRYVLHQDPTITLLTDIGLTTDLESLLAETFASALSPRLAEITGEMQVVLGKSDSFLFGNFQASIVSLVIQQEIAQGLAKREEIESIKPLHDLSILFLRGAGKNYAVGEREALFDPERGLIQARSPGDVPILSNIREERLRDILSTLIPASLSHELHHYLFFRPSVAESGFFLEGEATAYGEASFRGALAGLAVPINDPFRDFTLKAVPSGQPELIEQWLIGVQQRIEAGPFTANQCRFMRLLDQDYLRSGKDLPIERLLTLTPRNFQEQDRRSLESSYAVAWLIFHAADAKRRPWPQQLEDLVRRMNEGEPQSSNDAELIRTINRDAIAWLKEKVETQIQCDQPELRLSDIGSSSQR